MKGYKIRLLLLIAVCSILYSNCTDTKTNVATKENWLSLAIETEKYIAQSKYETPNGTTWQMMPDSIDSKGNQTLYHGSPGIILFYIELYNATKESKYLDEAIAGTEYLIETIPDTISNPYEVGLYVGVAGHAFTVYEMYKVTNDERYKQSVLRSIDLIEQSAEKSKNGIHWGQISEMLYGSAGIGLFMHYISDELESEKAENLSVQIAEGLLDSAIDTMNGLRWKFDPSYKNYTDNFSHGASGVAFFLSQTYHRTGQKKFLDASLKTAHLLDQLSNEKGYFELC